MHRKESKDSSFMVRFDFLATISIMYRYLELECIYQEFVRRTDWWNLTNQDNGAKIFLLIDQFPIFIAYRELKTSMETKLKAPDKKVCGR